MVDAKSFVTEEKRDGGCVSRVIGFAQWRMGFFNSDESGILQVYMVAGLTGL